MAKDPAFLFYPNDFSAGTALLTRHQKGCYMDILIAQFNHGHLSLENIRTVLGSDFPAWDALQKKFAQDAAGKFFNERLEAEMIKRKEYCGKQSERIKKRWDKDPRKQSGNTVVLPKREDENRNGIETEIQGGAGGILQPSQVMCEDFFEQCGKNRELGQKFYLTYSTTGWTYNNSPIRNWTALAQRWILNEKNYSNASNKQRDLRREPNPAGTKFEKF